jgi:type IV pilus assembly protein PilX
VNISMKKQRGIVLFFSLIILIVMTVIGVALAVNSTQSLRMSSAGSERIEAMSIANGALDLLIDNNKGAIFANLSARVDDNQLLGGAQSIIPMPMDGTITDVACQRSSKASGPGLITCRRLEITSSRSFGRENLGQLQVVAGIEQEVLP